jgi:hypothetical protein
MDKETAIDETIAKKAIKEAAEFVSACENYLKTA